MSNRLDAFYISKSFVLLACLACFPPFFFMYYACMYLSILNASSAWSKKKRWGYIKSIILHLQNNNKHNHPTPFAIRSKLKRSAKKPKAQINAPTHMTSTQASNREGKKGQLAKYERKKEKSRNVKQSNKALIRLRLHLPHLLLMQLDHTAMSHTAVL